MSIWILLTIFTLSVFLGYFVIWGVTPALYSPLMSVSNAISGIIILGAIIIAAEAQNLLYISLSLFAVFLASINIFGGFSVSQRMLAMFRPKAKEHKND